MSMTPGASIGPYRIVEQVGRGGMATVYKAYQPALARYVAIKVLPAFFAEDASFRERFQQEAVAIAKLRHPNILLVFDYGEEGGVTYLVSEYIDGGTLAERVGAPLPLEYVTRTLMPIASALDYAHTRGILHRDVKPSNILLAQDGTPVLADFGLAKILDSLSRLTRTGMTLGTPEYMAPEQGLAEQVGPPTDNYALAVVAYELLTGRVPFSAATPLAVLLAHVHKPLPLPTSVNPALPAPVEAVLLKGLAKEPADRFPTATEFVSALAEAGGAPSTATQPTAAAVAGAGQSQAGAPVRDASTSGAADGSLSEERTAATPGTRSRRLPAGLGLLAVLLVLALAGGAFAIWHGGSQQTAGATPTVTAVLGAVPVRGTATTLLVALPPPATSTPRVPTGATPRATTTTGPLATAPWTPVAATTVPPRSTATQGAPQPSATAAPIATPVRGPFATKAGSWMEGGALPRVGARTSMVTLPDGRLLVMGGYDTLVGTTAAAALYDPAHRRWMPTGSMRVPRQYFTATVLRDGRVLVAGGDTGHGFTASAELYDPARGSWLPAGAMQTTRSEHVAALLPDGTVLVAGGEGPSYAPLVSAEIYNPATGVWHATAASSSDHIAGTATVLHDGRVLVVGGDTRDAEIYRPRQHRWEPAGAMSVIRSGFTAIVLRDGRVLVAGGENPDNNTTWASAEIYDPRTRTWRATGAMTRPRTGQAAVLLGNGRVLVMGGVDGKTTLASTEIYDPATERWTPAGNMHQARTNATATTLANGTVLVAGGFADDALTGTFELFRPGR